ncbi:MAG: hypothetical protein JXX29_10745 [Deltaproteobacteria bacterium]|nr:hypothetical protein [Deltaproteobacteria bacterium]MBN2672146.1 hypothetical protein [Deltaproteobacteria bacterium]
MSGSVARADEQMPSANETNDIAYLLIYGGRETCADIEVIESVVAETDDLPVTFDVLYLGPEDDALFEEQVRSEMTTHCADTAFWFSCEDGKVYPD